MNDVIIVSRHTATIDFIRSQAGLDDSVPVLESATAVDCFGCVVYGNLPLHLAAAAIAVLPVPIAGYIICLRNSKIWIECVKLRTL